MQAFAERAPARAYAAPGAAVDIHPVVRWALYLFVFSIPLEIPRSPFPVELPAVTLSLFLASTVMHPSACYRRIPAALWWFTGYVFVSTLSFVVSGGQHSGEVRNLLFMLLQVVWLCWAGANVLRDDRVARSALIVLVAAGALRAGIQVLGIGTGTSAARTSPVRVTALGQNADFIAGIWAVALLVALHLASERVARPFLRRALLAGVILLMAATIMQTGSRGALVALVAGLLVYLGGRATAGIRLRDVVGGTAALVAITTLVFTSDTMRHRFAMSSEGNLAGREHIYPELLNMYVERPVLGWGPVANKYELAERLQETNRWERIARSEGLTSDMGRDPRWLRRDAHNIFLEALTSAGTPGFVTLAGGMLLCFLAAWQARRGPRGWLPVALFAVILTFNQSENRVTGKIEWLVLAFALSSAPVALHAPARVRRRTLSSSERFA
jgi:O-antigen ligase